MFTRILFDAKPSENFPLLPALWRRLTQLELVAESIHVELSLFAEERASLGSALLGSFAHTPGVRITVHPVHVVLLSPLALSQAIDSIPKLATRNIALRIGLTIAF